jgi:pyruvate/oxaloacetate carboxyltransferase
MFDIFRRRGPVDLLDTQEMATFFETLDHFNLEQLLSLGAGWQATGRQAHEDAWTTVRAVGARDGLTKEIDRVRNKALAWATRGSNSVPYNRMNDNDTWLQVKKEAGEAIVDAALAVALGGRLDEASRAILIGPWLMTTEALE